MSQEWNLTIEEKAQSHIWWQQTSTYLSTPGIHAKQKKTKVLNFEGFLQKFSK